MCNKTYERMYGNGLNKYYMIGGAFAVNKTQANKLMRTHNSIEKVVDSIINSDPINRKKSVNFIKSLAK